MIRESIMVMFMKMHEEHEVEKENGERWVLTYADLITLLMVFFVVMYSMSAVDSKKYAAVAEQLSITLGGAKSTLISNGSGADINQLAEADGNSIVPVPSADTAKNKDNPSTTPKNDKSTVNSNVDTGNFNATSEGKLLDDVEKKIREIIEKENLSAQVTVYKDSRGSVISFTEALLFDKGSADIHRNRIHVVSKISDIIGRIDNYIRIEGFTDDLPIHTSQFDSNWELAAQRAVNVGKAIIGYGINPNRVSCLSYGQYRPKASNESEDGRAKNRRVDIIIISKTLDALEPGEINP